MSECIEEAVLQAFLGDTLSRAESLRVRAHVDACAGCRGRLGALRERPSEPAAGGAGGLPEMSHASKATQLLRLAQNTDLDAGAGEVTPGSDSIPGYSIIREIDRGGQGVVYQAIQKNTRRKVAIKIMREGPFADRREKARFEREVEILAQLNHPNIVRIYDSGTAHGSFYFVMDFISGQPLDAWMDSGERSIEETLRLFVRICEAVNAAHLRGVIHRDLKPGNIRIDAENQPHVLDFGLAKAAETGELSIMTRTGQFMGSLPWASPEQAEAIPGRVDLRTDVYSLGVILYQMLTGKFPYDVVGNMRDVLDRILTAEPTPPSTIRRQINDEVETIVLKCLSKERERRYQTAGLLAEDIERYLRGEPIEAKRDSAFYVLKKNLERYKGVALASTAFLFVLVAGIVISSTLWVREREHRSIAQAKTNEAQQATTKAVVERERAETASLDAQLALLHGRIERIKMYHEYKRFPEAMYEFHDLSAQYAILTESHPGSIPPEVPLFLSTADLASQWQWYTPEYSYPTLRLPPEYWSPYTDLHMSVDTTYIVGIITATDTQRLTQHSPSHTYLLVFDRHARRLAWTLGSNEDTSFIATCIHATMPWVYALRNNGVIDIRDLLTGRLIRTFQVPKGPAWRAHMRTSPNGQHLLIAYGRVYLLNAKTGAQVLADNTTSQWYGLSSFSPDSSSFAISSSWQGYMYRLSNKWERRVLSRDDMDSYVYSSVYSPSGKYLATTSVSKGIISVRSGDTGETIRTFVAGHRFGDMAYFLSDENLLAIFSPAGVYIVDWQSGMLLSHINQSFGDSISLRAQQSSTHPNLFTCVEHDKQLRTHYYCITIPECLSPIVLYTSTDAPSRISDIGMSAGGEILCAVDVKGRLAAFRRTSHQWNMLWQKDTYSDGDPRMALSPDGQAVVAATDATQITEYDVLSGDVLWRVDLPAAARNYSYCPDSKLLASAMSNGDVYVWQRSSREQVRSLEVPARRSAYAVGFGPTGQYIVAADREGGVTMWDLHTGMESWRFQPGGQITDVAVSPNGLFLGIATWEFSLTVWDIERRTRMDRFSAQRNVAFDSDSRHLYGMQPGQLAVQVWDVVTRREATRLSCNNSMLLGTSSCMALSQDGSTVALGDYDGRIVIWGKCGTGNAIDASRLEYDALTVGDIISAEADND